MFGSAPSVELTSSASLRRHDLDAVRAFAMLLGIALHASLSFSTLSSVVSDTRQSVLYSLFRMAVHGFRMPLFFLVSGFFTAMLWRRRGLAALFKQRAVRILIPCFVGLVTIIPVLNKVSAWASANAVPAVPPDDGSIAAAVRSRDTTVLAERIRNGLNVNKLDASIGATPLAWAAMLGDTDLAKVLLDGGASVKATNGDGWTPLHSAAFLGRAKVIALLLEHGADANALSLAGKTPLETTTVDLDTTQFIAKMLLIPVGTETDLVARRAEVRRVLGPVTQTQGGGSAAGSGGGLVKAYRRFLHSHRWTVHAAGTSIDLIRTPVFHHLWFLWFLCWLVPIFAALAWAAERLRLPRIPRGLLHTPVSYLGIVPLLFIPQWFMGVEAPRFGPDMSIGIVPMPHLLLYYGIFFGFGALYYDANDDEGRLGRGWWFLLPFALVIVMPVALVTLPLRPVTAVAQVVYAWFMSFGIMGLFRRLLRRERRWVRYISDSSYWLYLTHVPLVISAQAIVAPWPISPHVKFVLILGVVTAILSLSYQLFVRYTWIGLVLNGPRTRPRDQASRAENTQRLHPPVRSADGAPGFVAGLFRAGSSPAQRGPFHSG
jgi:peptidoglycan/LPS O-acetylase OafA/YrhL